MTKSHPFIPSPAVVVVVLLACLIVWFADRRTGLVRKFLAEKRAPIDLAITRIVVFGCLLFSVKLGIILNFAALDAALLVPPIGWKHVVTHIPRGQHFVEAIYCCFVVAAIFAVVGLLSQASAFFATALGFYLLTLTQIFGKVDHFHHLILFGALLTFSPCGDALSMDRLIRQRKSLPTPPVFVRTLRHAAALKPIMLLLGLAYFFPGVWKVCRLGWTWFAASNLQRLLTQAMQETKPSAFQLWIVHQPTLLVMGAVFTIVFEVGFLFAVLHKRSRPLAAAGGVIFHNMTNLMMRISFIEIQFCYVALFDWAWISSRVSAALRRSEPIPVVDAIGADQNALTWSSRFIMIPLAGLFFVGMVLTGTLHMVNAWPISCYPTFDSSPGLETEVMIEARGKDGNIYRQNLTYDPVLVDRYGRARWLGLIVQVVYDDSPRRSAATAKLWAAAHDHGELSSATFYEDDYDFSKSRTVPLTHTVLRTVSFDQNP